MNVLEVSFALGSSTSLSIKFGALVHNELGLRAPSPVDIGHEWRKRVLGPEDPVTRGKSGVLLKFLSLPELNSVVPSWKHDGDVREQILGIRKAENAVIRLQPRHGRGPRDSGNCALDAGEEVARLLHAPQLGSAERLGPCLL